MLICSKCDTRYQADQPRWRCDCGSYLHLSGTGMFAKADLHTRPQTLWRYFESLGISNRDNIVSLGEGCTPLLEDEIYNQPVLFKMDQLCPTGSFKDRGTTVMVSKLKEWGVRHVVEDSSGNAGASVSAYTSRAKIQADIYIPGYTSGGKATQIALYGGNLVKVPGTREDTARAVLEAAESSFYASHNWSPYFVAGLKTVAYEVAEQLDWRSPDWIVLPVGGGSLFIGVYLGWRELVEAGYVEKMPRLVAVQADNCDPIYQAWKQGLDTVPEISKREGAAEGIAISQPVKDKDILQAIRDSDGIACTVTDEEIWETLGLLARRGVYVEPTSAATSAAIKQLSADGIISPQDRVVVQLTGMGLKATDKIVEHFGN